jgi:hypothetical protein
VGKFAGRAGQSVSARQSLQRMMANRQQPTGKSGETVQRFPANVLTQAFPWSTKQYVSSDMAVNFGGMPPNQAANYITVSKAAEGAKGGVYFFKSRDPNAQVTDLVVKPLFMGALGSAVEGADIAETFLEQFGIDAPGSRIIEKGDPEFDDLLSVVPAIEEMNRLVGFSVQMRLQNVRTIQSDVSDVQNTGDIDNIMDFLKNTPNLMETMGRLAAIDSVMGNFDRFTTAISNMGNLMYRMGPQQAIQTFAIDNEAMLPRLKAELVQRFQQRGEVAGDQVAFTEPLIKGLYDNRDQIIGGIANSIGGLLMARYGDFNDKITPFINDDMQIYEHIQGPERQRITGMQQEQAQVRQLANYAMQQAAQLEQDITARVTQGIDQGIVDIRALMAGNLQGGNRDTLKQKAQQHGAWSGLKANVKYLGLRDPGGQGLGHQQAAKAVSGYLQYRLMKEIPTNFQPQAAQAITYGNFKFPKEMKAGRLKMKFKKNSKFNRQQAVINYAATFTNFEADLQRSVEDLERLKAVANDIVVVTEQLTQEIANPDQDQARIKSLRDRALLSKNRIDGLVPAMQLALDNGGLYAGFATQHRRDISKHITQGLYTAKPAMLQEKIQKLDTLTAADMQDLLVRATAVKRRLPRLVQGL